MEDYVENSVIISWNPNFKTDGASHAILFTVMVLKKEFIQIQTDFFYLSLRNMMLDVGLEPSGQQKAPSGNLGKLVNFTYASRLPKGRSLYF